jgi:hypothetical protein
MCVCMYVRICMYACECMHSHVKYFARAHTHPHTQQYKKSTLAKNAPQTHSLTHTLSLTHTHIYPRIYFSSLDNKFWVPSNTVVVSERERGARETDICMIYTASLKYILFAVFVVCARCVCARQNLSVCMMSVFRWVGGWVLIPRVRERTHT